MPSDKNRYGDVTGEGVEKSDEVICEQPQIKTNKKQEASDVLNHLSFSASSRKLMRLIFKRAESI